MEYLLESLYKGALCPFAPASNTPADESPASFPAQPGTAAQRATLTPASRPLGRSVLTAGQGLSHTASPLFLDPLLTPPGLRPSLCTAACEVQVDKCRLRERTVLGDGQYGAPLRGRAGLAQEGWSPGAGRAERPCCRREAARAARLRTAPAVRAARRDYCETWADPVPAC